MHVVVKRVVTKLADDRALRKQRRIFSFRGQHRVQIRVRVDPVTHQKPLEVVQLLIDRLIAKALLRRHVRELDKDAIARLRQGTDDRDILPVRSALGAHAKVRIDENQRLDRQVFKLQVPGGVVRRDMRDIRHVALFQPFPGVVIVQIRNARHILAAAAEFADIVAQRGAGNERHIHGQARALCLPRGVNRDMANAEGMPRRIKRHDLLADAQQFPIIALSHRLGKERALRLDRARFQLLRRHSLIVQQRIVCFFALRVHEAGEHRKIDLERNLLPFIRAWRTRIGIKSRRERLVSMRQKPFLRQLARALNQRLAKRGYRGAGNALAEHGAVVCVKLRPGSPCAQLLDGYIRALRQLCIQRVQRAVCCASLVHIP